MTVLVAILTINTIIMTIKAYSVDIFLSKPNSCCDVSDSDQAPTAQKQPITPMREDGKASGEALQKNFSKKNLWQENKIVETPLLSND